MVLCRTAVPASPGRMLMAIAVVVVPDGAHVTRVGFEKESGNGVDAYRRHAADRTYSGSGRV